jgi:hypothetical protein
MTQYKVPPVVSQLPQKQLASGQFVTEDEVLSAALQALETDPEDPRQLENENCLRQVSCRVDRKTANSRANRDA